MVPSLRTQHKEQCLAKDTQQGGTAHENNKPQPIVKTVNAIFQTINAPLKLVLKPVNVSFQMTDIASGCVLPIE